MHEFRSFLERQLRDPIVRREYVKLWPEYLIKNVAIKTGVVIGRIRCRICRFVKNPSTCPVYMRKEYRIKKLHPRKNPYLQERR